MDFNSLVDAHEHSLMLLDRAVGVEERRAHSQFARDYAVRIRMVRSELGVSDAVVSFGHEPNVESPK